MNTCLKMETGKNFIATKVFDNNCDVCKHMSRHDKITFDEFPEITYREVNLDDIINHGGDRVKVIIYQLLERYCLSPSYEIDLPVYLMMDSRGQYLGHQQGAATIVELRDKIKECLEGIPA